MNKDTKSTYIIAGGHIDQAIKNRLSNSYYVICADSGYDQAIKLGLSPDVLVGDLDSISNEAREDIRNEKIRFYKYSQDQNMTDTELAINYAIDNGFTDIIIIGGIGPRADHSLSNILNLLKYKDYNIKIIDGQNTIKYIDENCKISLYKDHSYYSILALSEPGILLSMTGFEYDLNKELIKIGSSLGISNSIIDEKARIKVHKGYGLLIGSSDSTINLKEGC